MILSAAGAVLIAAVKRVVRIIGYLTKRGGGGFLGRFYPTFAITGA